MSTPTTPQADENENEAVVRCQDCGHTGPTYGGDCDRCGGPAMPGKSREGAS